MFGNNAQLEILRRLENVLLVLVQSTEMLIAETRLRNAQYDNLSAKVDFIVAVMERSAAEASQQQSETTVNQVLLPMQEGTM